MEFQRNLSEKSVKRAHDAFEQLEKTKGVERSNVVKAMAKAIKNSFDAILEANTVDLETSREMAVPEVIVDWLKLTPERLESTVEILQVLASLSDPVQRVINAPYQLNPSQTYSQLMPLGTIAFIYEGFPELAAIAAGFALKSGNSVVLRGSSEASHSNAIVAEILKTVLEDVGLPISCIEVISSEHGTSLSDLVTQDQYLNLIVPYGRPSLIQQVSQLATAPVLRSAMGNCYLYWSESGNIDLVRSMILASHASQPDKVNAIEKVVVNATQKPSTLVRLFNTLQEEGYELRGEKLLVEEFPEHLKPMKTSEWENPYFKKTIAFKRVENIDEAIAFINKHSSSHADCLVTNSYEESRQFATQIESALVYINCSSRFYRNPGNGESVFLGISNQKGHRRGLIGLETFTTVKQVVQGYEI